MLNAIRQAELEQRGYSVRPLGQHFVPYLRQMPIGDMCRPADAAWEAADLHARMLPTMPATERTALMLAGYSVQRSTGPVLDRRELSAAVSLIAYWQGRRIGGPFDSADAAWACVDGHHRRRPAS